MTGFLKKVIAFSLKNRYLILFLALLMVVHGIITFRNMPIEAFPDVTNTEISIITQWPGRSAEEVEKFITIPIELALNPVQQKISLRSTSIFGLSYVKLIFEDKVTDPMARQQVMNLLQNATLPTGIQPSVQPPTGPTGEIFRYTLRSNIRDVRDLKTIQDWVIDRRLRAVSGVGDIVAFGGKTKSYEIKVNPEKLASLNITSLDVFTAVQKTNINIGGDVIIQNNQAYVVRGIGLLNDINEIRNIIVMNNNGVPVLIKDVADVEISNIPRLGWVARADGLKDQAGNRKVTDEADVVEAIVLMRKGENPTQVLAALKKQIDNLNQHVLPADTRIVPYYDRTELIDFATHTVLHNLIEGILLVTLLVSLFMFNWRTTLIVSIIIPMALLFAFICLNFMGMSANLLSLGAVDFGIIIDGAVVMVEGMFVVLDHKSTQLGMERFNKLAKFGLIKNVGSQLGKAIFYAKVIIITGLLPIFAFQKVEGKMFSPLAFTLGFALLGALITTVSLVPVLISFLLKRDVRERHNPIVHAITEFMLKGFAAAFSRRKTIIPVSLVVMAVGLYSFNFLGSEFLPELNEGSIWLRIQTPYSISLEQSVALSQEAREILMKFPQVKYCVSQTGRPDDGTDVAGFYNNEFSVMLYPESEWNPRITKEELIDQMNSKLSVIPGANLNFSQPIMDNVEEAVSGVKGSICVKVYGDSLQYMENKITDICNVLKGVKGIEDLGVIHNLGQPELDILLDQQKMALYGVTTADASSVVAMAIGGETASLLYEGIRVFDIRVRMPSNYRSTPEEIGNVLVPTQNGSKVPIKEIAEITQKTGPCLIFRDDNERYAALKFSVRGRDMGSTIAEARRKVDKAISLNSGYRMAWQGDFENQQRAENRLVQVVPISLGLIFLLLFTMFGNLKDAALVFLNVPFAIVGGIMALHLTGTNFSISAGIGFIALFGICIQDGVLLITVFKQNMNRIRGHSNSLYNAIKLGVQSRIRPVMMTALMAAIGLFPAAISHGIGSESSRPLARVVIGGILCAMIFSLWVFPLIFAWSYKNVDERYRSHFDDADLTREDDYSDQLQREFQN
ncbi:MAG: CusA/CzcA family heavy metal efflux RND transporter [Marinilabiliales bacterium]|nr:CusA/CzcA family heavy metal efflux RND transporter [Marinilabiliales bacterium]